MAAPQTLESDREAPLPNRPKVPGRLGLRARSRGEQPPGSGRLRISERVLRWEVAQTAVIIRPLVIDPVIQSITYFGGNGVSNGYGVAMDSAANVYITGSALSANVPSTRYCRGRECARARN